MAKKQAYSQVEEVEASTIDFSFGWAADPEKVAFARDVIMRLENTNKTKAIRYLFNDRKTAEKYRQYTVKQLRTLLGQGKAKSRILPNEDGTVWVCFKNM